MRFIIISLIILGGLGCTSRDMKFRQRYFDVESSVYWYVSKHLPRESAYRAISDYTYRLEKRENDFTINRFEYFKCQELFRMYFCMASLASDSDKRDEFIERALDYQFMLEYKDPYRPSPNESYTVILDSALKYVASVKNDLSPTIKTIDENYKCIFFELSPYMIKDKKLHKEYIDERLSYANELIEKYKNMKNFPQKE